MPSSPKPGSLPPLEPDARPSPPRRSAWERYELGSRYVEDRGLFFVGCVGTFLIAPWLLFLTGPVGRHNWFLSAVGWSPINLTSYKITLAGYLITSAVVVSTWLLISAFRRGVPVTVLAGCLAVFLVEMVGLFSALYAQADHEHPIGHGACFAPMQHAAGLQPAGVQGWDALYVTVGTLSTAGTGTLQPLSTYCRQLVTAQMLLDFTIIAIALTMIIARLTGEFAQHARQ